MAVRNAAITVTQSGRKNDTVVCSGTGAQDGFTAVLNVREHGAISDTSLITRVTPVTNQDGNVQLFLTVDEYTVVNGQEIGRVVYSRWLDR